MQGKIIRGMGFDFWAWSTLSRNVPKLDLLHHSILVVYSVSSTPFDYGGEFDM